MLQRSAKGGGLPVGAALSLPDVGPRTVMGDGSIWLRTGWLVSAPGYAAASKVAHLKAHMLTGRGVGTSSVGIWRSVATNGAGTYVAAGDTANLIFRSGNGGANWTPVNHNLSGPSVNRVVWTGSLFVAVGNTSTIIAVSTSPDGITWTQRLSVAVPGGDAVANSAVAATNGAGLHAVCLNPNSSAVGWVWTSADGINWAQRNGVQGTASSGNCSLAIAGDTIYACAGSGARFSNDRGATWGYVVSGGAGWAMPVNGGINVNLSGSNWQRAVAGTDMSSSVAWRPYTAPPAASGNAAVQPVVFGGSTHFWMTGGIARIDDDILWTLQGVDVFSQITNGACWAFGANDMVMLPVGAAAPYYAATSPAGANNAVGVLPAHTDGTGSQGSPVYVRIK